MRARHSSPAAPRSHASPASSRHSHFPMALAAEVCAASRIAENPSVLFLLDFFPHKVRSRPWKPAVDHSGRPRVDRRSKRGGAALELDLGLPDSPQAGRGFVVGQRAVKPLLLVWNRCFSVLLASEVPSQAAHGAMPADPTRGSIGSTKTMSGARFCEHRVWVSCCILARSMRAHANDSQCCC